MPCSRFLPALCIASLTGLIAVLPVTAQITVTADDFAALLGRSFIEELYGSTENEDAAALAAALADQSGPNQTWDLTPLAFELQDSSTWSYFGASGEVPGGDDPAFASANWISIAENETARDVSFNELSSDNLIHLGSISYPQDGSELTTRYRSGQPAAKVFPLTYRTMWEYETEVTSNNPFASGTYTESAEVDAYGTIQTPAGTFEVLRVFRETQFTSSLGTSTTRTYTWLSSDSQSVASVICPFFPGAGFVCSTVHIEREETNSVLVSADGLAAFDGTGVTINLTGVSGSGTVTVNRYDTLPANTEGIAETNVSSYRVVIDVFGGLTIGTGTEVRFSVADFSGVTDPTDVTVYSRETPGQGPFAALPTSHDSATNEIVATVDGFSEFVLASDTNPLPVELTTFDATFDNDGVLLQWTTASEMNNAGFKVQMRRSAEGPFAAQGFVDGHGTTTEAQTYRFRVDDLAPGTYVFRLKQVDLDGTAEMSPVVEVTAAMKEAYLLSKAFPNPFRGEAWLTLQVREAQTVRADLYDVLGRRVATLHDGTLDAGREHRLALDGHGLSSGLYLVRVVGERFAETRRVVVAR